MPWAQDWRRGKHFAAMFYTFGVHLGAYWTFWGSFWCHFDDIFHSWSASGPSLGLEIAFSIFLITFGTILGSIFGSFGDLQEPLAPPDGTNTCLRKD